MKDIRPFASLSSSLLARKGGARPAMRPNSGKSLEDLGWNDMGHDLAPLALTPMPTPAAKAETPAPIAYRAAIEENFAPEPAPAPAARPARVRSRVTRKGKPAKAAAPAVAILAKGKTAFTLRLDGDRHLRLRLACVLANQSAQKIVTKALDAFLDTIPNINTLADQVPQHDAGQR